jgi:hypothetical protein
MLGTENSRVKRQSSHLKANNMNSMPSLRRCSTRGSECNNKLGQRAQSNCTIYVLRTVNQRHQCCEARNHVLSVNAANGNLVVAQELIEHDAQRVIDIGLDQRQDARQQIVNVLVAVNVIINTNASIRPYLVAHVLVVFVAQGTETGRHVHNVEWHDQVIEALIIGHVGVIHGPHEQHSLQRVLHHRVTEQMDVV